MARKENDLMMNMVANPNFSLADFGTMGFTTDNTSLESASVYKSNPFIQQAFSDENGKFNEQAFQSAYQSAVIGYNSMANKEYGESQLKIFHRNDISAPDSMRREGPDFRLIVVSNPDRSTFGIYRLGEEGPRSKSRDELAQANKVLLNPAEVYKNGQADWGKAQWGDSPNDSFWGYFTDTLVLALYDSDGTHVDPITGEKVDHKKGELIIGPGGSYFYEKLDGRDIYGRKVLNKMNVLTEDGSFWNKYDFFDSDDIEQKSIGGTIMKNLALVGTMFIPYVGPWVTGASIATLLVGLMGTLGKMVSGSDSPLFSEMEGWSKSMNRQTAKSEYAEEHPWCIENWINLIGDVSGLLKEQRFFFEKVPALFKGGYAGSLKAYDKKLAEFLKMEKGITDSKLADVSKLVREGQKTHLDYARAMSEWRATEAIRAQGAMDSWMKGYNKIGEIFSKGYMTAITVGDTYGEAKAAGASDLDATLLTLGYAAGEYAILNTGIGEWILPELRADRYKNKAIINALKTLNKEGQASWSELGNAVKLFDKNAKKEYVKNVFNIGKNIARAEYANGTRTLQATLAAGMGEGVEEVTEELLADFSKGCFNTVKWLQGEETRLDSFGFRWDEDGNRTWNGGEIWDRYGMSFFGGFIGGGLTNAGTSYRMGKSLSNMTSVQAMQEITYMARNNQLDSLYKTLDKMDVANKRLSASEFEDVDGVYVAKPGTTQDNLDALTKRAIRQQIQLIDNIIKAEGAALSDLSFLDSQTNILGDLRFNALHNAKTAGLFMQEFNTLVSDIGSLVLQLNNNTEEKTDTLKRKEKNDESEDIVAQTTKADLKKQLNEKRKQLKDLLEGKRSDEFVGITLFEMSNLHDLPVNFPMYVYKTTGKKILEITNSLEKAKLRKEYEDWMKSDGIDRIVTAAKVYMDMALQSSEVINNHWTTYQNQSLEILDINNIIINLYNNLLRRYDDNAETNPTEFLKGVEGILNSVSIANKIGKKLFESEFAPIMQYFKTELDRINSITDPVQKEMEEKNLMDKTNSDILELTYNKFNEFIAPFIQQGFANADVKNQFRLIIHALELHTKHLLDALENAGVTEDTFDFATPEQQEEFDKYYTRQFEFNDLKDKIDDLKNTPFEQNLDQFAISIGANPINYTQLIDKLDTIFNNLEGSVLDFNIEDEVLEELVNAISIAEMYQQSIEGAKVDNANLNDLFGYNKIMNEVSKKLGKDLNLAEIDGNFAELLKADVNEGLERLKFLYNLYTINQGQKMVKQLRIAVKKDVLLYNGLRTIVSIKDDDDVDLSTKDAAAQLYTILEGLDKISKVSSKKNYSLSEEERIEFEKQKLQMEDAIYDFFQSIKDEDLYKVIGKFDLYTRSPEILNEELEELDGPSMVWYLATRAAVKSSDFYEAFRTILSDEEKLIPIATQEMAVQSNYAALVNGNVITKFFNAYRLHIKEDWIEKEIDDRKEVLKKLGYTETTINKLVSKDLENHCLNFLPIARYSNINLVEGAPGTGKSAAVMALTGRLINKFHPELVSKVAYVHGANTNSAKGLLESVGIQGETFGIIEFMQRIAKNYKSYDYDDNGSVTLTENDYQLNSDNEIVGTLQLKDDNQPFSVIFIDEVSKFNLYELDLINEYAKKYGITVITAGDFDLTGVEAAHEVTLNNKTFNRFSINLERNMFCRTPKLGVSMRTDNVIMSNDLTNFRTWMVEESNEPFDLHYYKNEETKELFGNRVFDSAGISEELKAEIQDMINNLSEDEKKLAELNTDGDNGPIGFIYNNPNSILYKYLHDGDLAKYFAFRKGGTAQGLEGRFYVIDASLEAPTLQSPANPRLSLSNIDKKEIYTGISRASQGTILFINSQIPISEKQTNKLIKEPLGDSIRKLYIEERKKILAEAVDGKVPSYEKRTPNGINNDLSLDDIVKTLPDTIQEDVNKAVNKAIAEPRTKATEPTLFENDDTSDFSYGDLVLLKDGSYGVVVGISNKYIEVLDPSLKTTDTFGYLLKPVNKIDIKDILYYKKENKPHIPSISTFSQQELINKWDSRVTVPSIEVEYDNKKATLNIVPIHVEHEKQNGDIITQEINIIDVNGDKVVQVQIGNYIQPFICQNGNWKPTNTWSSSLPLLLEIAKVLDATFGTNLKGTSLGPNIDNAINKLQIIDLLKNPADEAGRISSINSNWDSTANPINIPLTVTINENGTNSVLKAGDKLYTQGSTLTITDIKENNGNRFILTDGNKTYSIADIQSKINSGEWSLKPFKNSNTIEFDLNGLHHTLKVGDIIIFEDKEFEVKKLSEKGIVQSIDIKSLDGTRSKGFSGTLSVQRAFESGEFSFIENIEPPQIINQSDFNIDELDFTNNIYVIHLTDLTSAESIILTGLKTPAGLNATSELANRDSILNLLLTMKEGHGHRASDHLVILKFPRNIFGKEKLQLDDISHKIIELGEDPEASFTVPTKYIDQVVKVEIQPKLPSETGELDLNGTIIKVGDKVCDILTNEEVQILAFEKNPLNDSEIVIIQNENKTYLEQFSLDDFKSNFITTLAVLETSIELGGNILEVGDVIYSNNNKATITKIESYQEGNPRIYLLFDDGTLIHHTYKKLVKQFDNGKITLVESKPKELDLSNLDGEGPIVDTMKNPVEYRKELDAASSNKKTPRLNVILKSNQLGVDIFLHSMNTYELGVLVDRNNNILWDDNWNTARIDSVNGLRRIDLIHGNPDLQSVEYYKEWIGELRSHIFNATDISDLVNNKLKDSLGLDDLSIRFIFKASPVWASKNSGYVGNRPHPTSKHRGERSYNNRATDTRSDDVIPHTLSIVISSRQYKDVLELPLLTLTNPITFAQIKDNNGAWAYPPLYNIYASYKPILDSLRGTLKYGEKFDEMMVEMLTTALQTPGYQNIANFIELFRYSYGGYFRIPDPNWLPSTHLLNLGSQFSIHKGIHDIEDGFKFNSEDPKNWISIDKYCEDDSITVTPIMKVISDKITIDNEEREGLIKPGHPFVLICFDKSIQGVKNIINQWKELQKPGYNGIQKVRLQHVQTPELESSAEYLQYLKILYTKGSKNTPKLKPGNFHTPYLIFDNLLNNPEFLEIAKNRVILYEVLEKYILKLRTFGDNVKARHQYLISDRLDLNGDPIQNLSVGNFLAKALMTVAYDITTPTPNQLNNNVDTLDDRVVKLIDQVLKDREKRLYYWPNTQKGNTSSIGLFIKIETDGVDSKNLYKINGKDCLINGKIDPYMFLAEMSSLINYWVSLIQTDSRGNKYTNKQYGANDYNIDNSIWEGNNPEPEAPKQQSEAFKKYNKVITELSALNNSKINAALELFNLRTDPLHEFNSTNDEFKNKLNILNQYLKDQGILSFEQNGKIIIPLNLNNSIFENVISVTTLYQNLPINNLNGLSPKIDTVIFTKLVQDESGNVVEVHETYSASYENGILNLINQDGNNLANVPITLSVNESNLLQYLQGVDNILTKLDLMLPRGLQMNPKYFKLKRAILSGLIQTIEDLYNAQRVYSKKFSEQTQSLLQSETDPTLKLILLELINYNESRNPDLLRNCPITIPIKLI